MTTNGQERIATWTSTRALRGAFFVIPILTVTLLLLLLPVRARADQAAAQRATVPVEDGVYMVSRIVDHAVTGYLELSLGVQRTWLEVGPRVRPTRATMTSQTAANDLYDLLLDVPRGSGGCTSVLLRVDGVWHLYQTNGGGALACHIGDRIADSPAGFAARVATVIGTSLVAWIPFGDRITATFTAAKPVFLRGEDPEILLTIRNPADALAAHHPFEPVSWIGGGWRFTITRDGVDIPQPGLGGNGGRPDTVLAPGDSVTTIFRPRSWGLDLITPGHYVVAISKSIRFRPMTAADNQRAPRPPVNPGGERTFTDTVEFDIASTLMPGAAAVRGRVTGEPALAALVEHIYLGVPGSDDNRSLSGDATRMVRVGADGAFEFTIVRAGSYDLGTMSPIAPFRRIVVDGQPLDIEIPVRTRVVRGRVTTSDGQAPPTFTLVIGDEIANPKIPRMIAPAPDGTFEVTLPLGRWTAGAATGLPAGRRLIAERYGSVDLLGPSLPPRAALPASMLVGESDGAELVIGLGPIEPVPMSFVTVAPGEFMMGCSSDDTTCTALQRPAHPVRISQQFEVGAHEVTRAQWKAVMTTLPYASPRGTVPAAVQADDRRPVQAVTWTDVQEFLRRLNGLRDGYSYRLPTEAEWEYAARAGTTTSGKALLNETAWFRETAGGWTHPVGEKPPNPWGLYDMLGNVEELVQDFHGAFVAGTTVVDPTGPATGTAHVVRGGSASYSARASSLSVRYSIAPDLSIGLVGFRVVREPSRQASGAPATSGGSL
jgi:hypothetical protein